MRWMVLMLTAAALTVTATGAAADGLTVEPGKWEMTTTTQNPMLPEPQTQTSTECITETESVLDPESFQDPASGCRVADSEVSGDTLSWTLTCSTPSGEMQGQGEMTSQGDRIEGSMSMVMQMEGQRMNFDSSWEGRRVGPCD